MSRESKLECLCLGTLYISTRHSMHIVHGVCVCVSAMTDDNDSAVLL